MSDRLEHCQMLPVVSRFEGLDCRGMSSSADVTNVTIWGPLKERQLPSFHTGWLVMHPDRCDAWGRSPSNGAASPSSHPV